MSSTKLRARISRRTAATLATLSVVAAGAGAAPSTATASGDASGVKRHAITQARSADSASTAPNLRVKATNGVTYQYRRFGTPSAKGVPLVFLMHLRGSLDNWDPQLIDTVAAEREVILVDNVGVAGSSGVTPSTVEEMTLGATAFLDALKVPRYDVFGFSLGGFIAQEVALRRPWQVRRLVLAGTGPQGGKDMQPSDPKVMESVLKDTPGLEDLLTLFFKDTDSSRAKGIEYLQRLGLRTTDPDAPVTLATRDAQLTAILTWGIPDKSKLVRLTAINQPVLVANGDKDIMVPTKNSYLMAKHLPNARLSIYPDAGHGFLFQYPVKFGTEVNAFLGR